MNVKEVERPNHNQDRPLNITLDDGTTITAQELLVAIGRTPNTDTIGLETIGLIPGDWLQVDDTCLVQGVEGDWLYAVGTSTIELCSLTLESIRLGHALRQ